jgi:hypothetical protein
MQLSLDTTIRQERCPICPKHVGLSSEFQRPSFLEKFFPTAPAKGTISKPGGASAVHRAYHRVISRLRSSSVALGADSGIVGRVVREIQRRHFAPRRAHPHVPLFVGGQDHRHGLGMDRLDHRVRRCREKTIDLMRPWHWLRLRAAIPVERRPDASEGEAVTAAACPIASSRARCRDRYYGAG